MENERVAEEYVFGRFSVATWAYINRDGDIRFQGMLKYGDNQTTIIHVMGHINRADVRKEIGGKIGELLSGDLTNVVSYLSGSMDSELSQLHRRF
jgi:hypothetical protein